MGERKTVTVRNCSPLGVGISAQKLVSLDELSGIDVANGEKSYDGKLFGITHQYKANSKMHPITWRQSFPISGLCQCELFAWIHRRSKCGGFKQNNSHWHITPILGFWHIMSAFWPLYCNGMLIWFSIILSPLAATSPPLARPNSGLLRIIPTRKWTTHRHGFLSCPQNAKATELGEV